MILGLAMIYSIVHFFALQKKAHADRTSYEKAVSIFAQVTIILLLIAIITE